MTSSPKGRPHRPLSPHLQIYRPQLTSVLSILHRLSGIFLFGAAFLWSAFLCIPDAYLCPLRDTLWMRLSVILFTSLVIGSLFYHLLNGVRHLFWDGGHGLELSQVYRSGWWVLGASTLLSLLTIGWMFR